MVHAAPFLSHNPWRFTERTVRLHSPGRSVVPNRRQAGIARTPLQQKSSNGSTEVRQTQIAAPEEDGVSGAVKEEAKKDGRALKREQSMEEYQQLKAELYRLTGAITGLGSAFCFLAYSAETSLSFAFGCLFSVAYLQELYKAADATSRDTVPTLFQGRIRRKLPGSYLVNSLQREDGGARIAQGMQLALSSPRLLLPSLLLLSWAASRGATGGDPTAWHLELAPLLLGFFSYKGAVLVKTLNSQLDLP